MQPNMIKIGADGQQLPNDATEWVAVLLPDHGLTFTRKPINDDETSQRELEKQVEQFELLGGSGWDLPTIDELQLLIDRSTYNPATYTAYFDLPSDWVWSKTPAAWSSASAWCVHFSYGYVGYGHRDYDGFALAVRRAGQ